MENVTLFAPLISKLKSDLQRCNILHLTLAGRVNYVKMNTNAGAPFHCTRDAHSTNWICKAFLQWPRAGSGLVLPNFRGYYLPANVQKMSYWIQSPVQTGVSWKARHAYHPPSMPWLHLFFLLIFHSLHPTQLSSPLSKYGLNLGDIIIWRKLFWFRARCVTITTSYQRN